MKNKLHVIQAPNNILRHSSKPVKKLSGNYQQTFNDMIKLTKSFVDPEGVGLAAPQVGVSEQFFVAKFEEFPYAKGQEFTVVINPKVIRFGQRNKKFLEGCLSIPDYYGEILRPTTVDVEFMDREGEMIKTTLKGLNAMIFQHEYDHLHGKLFMDYVIQQQAPLYKVTGKDRSGADIFEEVVL